MAMDRDAEIARINDELDILRSRHALYRRWARILKVFFMIWTPFCAVLFLLAVVKLFSFDLAIGIVSVGLAVIIAGLIWLWAPYPADRQPEHERGWVDLASLPIRRTTLSLLPSFYAGRSSDADMIEEQIAFREQRLKELDVRS